MFNITKGKQFYGPDGESEACLKAPGRSQPLRRSGQLRFSHKRTSLRVPGVYPFAGRECARAFALLSTEIADCNADLKGLSPTEMESLREWKAKVMLLCGRMALELANLCSPVSLSSTTSIRSWGPSSSKLPNKA